MQPNTLRNLKVLVVEDSAPMRKLIVDSLQVIGFTKVVCASDGDSAWKIVKEIKPDLVLTDWLMKEMSGMELLKRIRTHAASPNPHMPVILITGNTSLEQVRAAREAGVTEFIAKPVSMKVLSSRVEMAIERPRAHVLSQDFNGPCRRRRDLTESQLTERRR